MNIVERVEHIDARLCGVCTLLHITGTFYTPHVSCEGAVYVRGPGEG